MAFRDTARGPEPLSHETAPASPLPMPRSASGRTAGGRFAVGNKVRRLPRTIEELADHVAEQVARGDLLAPPAPHDVGSTRLTSSPVGGAVWDEIASRYGLGDPKA